MPAIALTVTDAGSAAFAAAINSGASVDINRIQFGDDATEHDASSIQLGNPRGTFQVESIERNGETVTFKVTIPQTWGDVTLREVGLIAVDGTLIAVGNFEFYKPASGGLVFELNFEASLTLADADAISTVVEGVIAGVNANLRSEELPRVYPDYTGLTGGTSADLNSRPTINLPIGRFIILPNLPIGPKAISRFWILDSGPDAEDPASGIIHPADHDEEDNPKFWRAV